MLLPLYAVHVPKSCNRALDKVGRWRRVITRCAQKTPSLEECCIVYFFPSRAGSLTTPCKLICTKTIIDRHRVWLTRPIYITCLRQLSFSVCRHRVSCLRLSRVPNNIIMMQSPLLFRGELFFTKTFATFLNTRAHTLATYLSVLPRAPLFAL